MKIIIASKNKSKIKATEQYFASKFCDDNLLVKGIEVNSNVSSKPINFETFVGTNNRIFNAINAEPKAEIYVAIEGGFFKFGKEYFIATVACICVDGTISTISTGVSDFYQIPESAFKCIQRDISLNEIISKLENNGLNGKIYKQEFGIVGFLTDGKVIREQINEQALSRCQEDIINKWQLKTDEDLISLTVGGRVFRIYNEKYKLLDEACSKRLTEIENIRL